MATINYFYTKSVLEKAANDPTLFKKELDRGLENLFPFEVLQLVSWLKTYTSDKPELKKVLKEIQTVS